MGRQGRGGHLLYSILRLASATPPTSPLPSPGRPGPLAVSLQSPSREGTLGALSSRSAGSVCASTPAALGCLRTEAHFFLLFMGWSARAQGFLEASLNICHEHFAAVKTETARRHSWMRLLQATPPLLQALWPSASHPTSVRLSR